LKERLVGYCVGNWDGELLHSRITVEPGAELLRWAMHPNLAHVFPTRQAAEQCVRELERPDRFVVELYDMGDQWFVDWPEGVNV